jgi:4-hydroxythreonine-4-phosphate dehydrogenase
MTNESGFHPAVVVLADDLSGAAEAASVFLGRRPSPTLRLHPGARTGPGVTVVDLNTRALTVADAQRAVRAASSGVPADAMVIAKIDSLLRGHVAGWTDVLAERGPVIVAAALPALRRTVRDGVLHVDGVPLHQTRAWHAEKSSPPVSLAELFGTRPTLPIPAGADLLELLPHAAAEGRIAICDVEDDTDLDRVLAASRAVPGAHLVGTSALAAAVARTLPPGFPDATPRTASHVVLTVVGTAEPVAAVQVSHLVASGTRHLAVDADHLLSGTADPATLTRELDGGSVVLTIGGDVRPARSEALATALAGFVVAGQAPHRADLVLTGGATARAVVDALGLTALQPVREVHHGAVVSIASDGRAIVTRPGSFGDPTSLTAISRHLTEDHDVQPRPKALT